MQGRDMASSAAELCLCFLIYDLTRHCSAVPGGFGARIVLVRQGKGVDIQKGMEPPGRRKGVSRRNQVPIVPKRREGCVP